MSAGFAEFESFGCSPGRKALLKGHGAFWEMQDPVLFGLNVRISLRLLLRFVLFFI